MCADLEFASCVLSGRSNPLSPTAEAFDWCAGGIGLSQLATKAGHRPGLLAAARLPEKAAFRTRLQDARIFAFAG
jgi:hypothetical protein